MKIFYSNDYILYYYLNKFTPFLTITIHNVFSQAPIQIIIALLCRFFIFNT